MEQFQAPMRSAPHRLGAGKEVPRIAFIAAPLSGHLRLPLALAQEMAGRGYAVDFLVGMHGMATEAQESLRALQRRCPAVTVHTLAVGRDLASSIDFQRVAGSSGRFAGSMLALMEELVAVTGDGKRLGQCVELWRAMIQVLASRMPDLVVMDHVLPLPQLWAEYKGIPTVLMHTSYSSPGAKTGCARMYPWQKLQLSNFVSTYQPWERLEERKKDLGIGDGFHVRPVVGGFDARPGVHALAFCEPELLNVPGQGMPPRVHVVGPCFSQDNEALDTDLGHWLDEALAQNQRVLYMSLGTLGNGFLTPVAVRTLLDAFANLGRNWRVLWSLPEAQHPLLERCGRRLDPDRVRVERYVRQRAVLAHEAARLFLTHGGQSSVNEAVAAGVPLVCLPLFCDQYEAAEAVQRHGLGLVFHKDELLRGRHRRLTAVLLRVAGEPLFQGTVRRHASLMHIRGGCGRAATVLESIIHGGVDFQELWRGPPRDLSPSGLADCLRGVGRLCGNEARGNWGDALSRCLQAVPPIYSRFRTPAAKAPVPDLQASPGGPHSPALGGA